jgi:NAD(P)-dependent dehydrogenase (short-subunit alcohol dehydrogenase family)
LPERIAVVTGASAGIGLYTTLGLARAGVRVILVGRSPERIENARRFVADRVAGAQLETALADFASLKAVRGLAHDILSRHDRLDVLVNNAGLTVSQFTLSADGYEMVLAVNHLAPFLLTNLLLDRLKASAPARIVTVASKAHHSGHIGPADATKPDNWSALAAYSRSKLANILFTRALARRLDAATVTASCLHPGVINTAIGDHAGLLGGLAWRLARPFMPGPAKGAETSIFLATTPDPTPFHGAYLIDKKIAEPSARARDETLGEALWAESARLVGL